MKISSIYHMFILAVPMTMSSSLLYTVGTAELTLICKEQPATAIAWGHATRTGAGIVTPLLGSALLANYGFSSIGATAALMCLLGFVSGEVWGYGVSDMIPVSQPGLTSADETDEASSVTRPKQN